MMFSRTQLDQFADIGVFRPNGLNDEQRADMRGDRPFYAIDSVGTSRVDDAIRVLKRPDGGYVVETAIVDGGQLADAPDIVERAVARTKRAILPRNIIPDLELSGGEQRALVVSRKYSRELEADDAVQIIPATISVVNTSYHAFSLKCLAAELQGKPNDALVGFNHRYREHHGLLRKSPRAVLEGGGPITDYGNQLVATYMVLANVAVSEWAEQAGVPIIHRNFDGGKTVWDELNEEGAVHGVYAVDAEIHGGINRIIPEAEAGYTHATSPLRRAVDLVNHLQIASHLAGRDLPYDREGLERLSSQFSRRRADATS